MKFDLIKRRLLDDLKGHLSAKEISLIVGPRQAGKTTLMMDLKSFAEKQGLKTVFLSLDFEEDRPFFNSQQSLLDRLRLEFGDRSGVAFIDEIQRKEDAGLFLKGIQDRGIPYKLVVSGSGSVELKEKVHESLMGRKRLFELSTVTFWEFAQWKTDYRYEDRLEDYFTAAPAEARRLLEEYLSFGGYPRVVLESTRDGKRILINEIYKSYLEKDMAYLLRMDRTDDYGLLLKVLSRQIGRLVNFAEISRTLDLALPTVRNYFRYAEKTFMLERVTPFFRNVRKEITKSPTVYFADLGLRNFVVGLFGTDVDVQGDRGFLFQNFVYRFLKENSNVGEAEFHHWRTKYQAEVDLVVELNGAVVPVEIKYQSLKGPAVERSLRHFIDAHAPSQAVVVNLNWSGSVSVGKTTVHFLPFWKCRQIKAISDLRPRV